MLVDTDVVSFFYKKDTRARAYEQHLAGQTLFISFVTVAELYRWPFERNWGERRKRELMVYLRRYAVLPYDDALAWVWAELVGKTSRIARLRFTIHGLQRQHCGTIWRSSPTTENTLSTSLA